MSKYFKKTLLTALLVSGISLHALPSFADKDFIAQHDPHYIPDFVDSYDGLSGTVRTTSGIVPAVAYRPVFIREENSSGKKEFTIRLEAPGSIAGCLNVRPTRLKTNKRGRAYVIEIDPAEVKIDDSPRYNQHPCKMSTNGAYADVTITSDELQEFNANKIDINIREMGTLLSYEIAALDDEKVFLVAPPNALARLGMEYTDNNNKIVHWFYPKNTVILFNNSIDMNEDNQKKVIEFARARGLFPLTDFLPQFRTSEANKDKLYFVDVDGAYAHQLDEADEITKLGNIELTELINNAEGLSKVEVKRPIFIKTPGIYE